MPWNSVSILECSTSSSSWDSPRADSLASCVTHAPHINWSNRRTETTNWACRTTGPRLADSFCSRSYTHGRSLLDETGGAAVGACWGYNTGPGESTCSRGLYPRLRGAQTVVILVGAFTVRWGRDAHHVGRRTVFWFYDEGDMRHPTIEGRGWLVRTISSTPVPQRIETIHLGTTLIQSSCHIPRHM